GVDTDRMKWVDVDAANFYIFDAAFLQCMERAFATSSDPFWADTGVVLVLDLQNVCAELQPFTILVRAEFFVFGPRLIYSVVQVLQVRWEVGITGFRSGLRFILIAEIAHAQAGGPGQVKRVAVQAIQLVRFACQKSFG